MKGVTVSWVGSFALPRCSISSGNRPRTRRTKEERRTMVMSFIKKYQSSNNGKFPSLNLTHKEVGGSFYTVREIFRDIIQENKVLGPGQNLEYYLGEVDKDSFLDVHRNISDLAIVNGLDKVHHEFVPSIEGQEIPSNKQIAIEKPVTLFLTNTYLNEYSSWPLLQGEPSNQEKSSDGVALHEEAVKTGTTELNVHILTEKKDAYGGPHQINTEVQLSSPEELCIQYAKQSVPYPTSSGACFIENELKNEDMHNKIPVGRYVLEEGTNIAGMAFADSLPGTNFFFSDIVDDQSNCLSKHDSGKAFQLVADNLSQDSPSEIPFLAFSSAAKISRSDHKVPLTAGLFEEEAVDISELETASLNTPNNISSTSESSSIVKKGVTPFIPFDKEHIKNGTENREIPPLSERGVDVATEAIENDIHVVHESTGSVDAINESENASSKLLKSIIHECEHAGNMAEKQSVASDIMLNGDAFMSSSKDEATEESDILQTNPVWAAIKSFASSFIKFWSE